MKKQPVKYLVLAGLFLALGLIMPFLTAQIPSVGSRLLPMHIPVLLCGFICGWPYGLIVGLITPILRSILFGMPPMFPTGLAMAFELAAYGFASGLLYGLFPKNNPFIYAALIISMVLGRVVWGVASIFLFGIINTAFTWKIFMTGAFINAIPGIVIQILLIPVIIIALQRARLIDGSGI